MSQSEKISLKAFWEAVEQKLAKYSADELRAILRALAQETPPTERIAFLAKLKSMKGAAASVQKKLRQDELLDEIDDLVQEIQDAREGADDAEEYDRWGDYYSDEDSLGPYEEFIKPLISLLDRAQALFEYGNFSLAREAYHQRSQAKAYDEAVGQLVKLRELSEFQNTQPDFKQRLSQLRERYRSRHSFLQRLERVGLG